MRGPHGGRDRPAPAGEVSRDGRAPPALRAGLPRMGSAVLTVRQFGDDPDKARPRYPEFLERGLPRPRREEDAGPGHRSEGERRRAGRIRQAPLRPRHGPAVPVLRGPWRPRRTDYDLFRYTNETAAGSGGAGHAAP
ncbi:MAG: hypothetical protein M0C28_47655 [Candidatus Moduliflexus flocculans]|nr:hypothetical protein [Candidatus Moduliflexus flocculans]